MSSNPDKDTGGSRLYKFFEISLGFVITMGMITVYIIFLGSFLETYIIADKITDIDLFIVVGSVGGAISVVVASSIRELGNAISEREEITNVNIFLGPPEVEEGEEYGKYIVEGKDKKENPLKEKGDKEVYRDFSYY